MAKKEMQKVLSQADMMNLLDSLYSKKHTRHPYDQFSYRENGR